MHRISQSLITIAALIGLVTLVAFAQAPADPLAQGFRHPPDSARPRTWWHWTASNVSKEGITKDLEWMKRVGIGGFQLADVNAGGGVGFLFHHAAGSKAICHTPCESKPCCAF